jgi:hypothetical protein
MKYVSYTLVALAYLALVGYVVYLTQNPWWILMSLFVGALPSHQNDTDKEDEE